MLVLDGHKLLWHKSRVEAWLRGERIAPITIELALTRSCTYKCLYCYGKLQTNDIKKMTWKVIAAFLEDTAEIGVKSINFTGDGESTCSPYLYRAIRYGNELGMDIALGTNGYFLDNSEILNYLTYVRFNISAAESKRYSRIHGCEEKCFEAVLNSIRECVEYKREFNLPVTIGLQMVLLPEFSDQIIPLTKLGKSLGVDYLVIKHCSDDEFNTLGIDYNKYDELVPVLKEAENLSIDKYLVKVKWSKILSGGKRNYIRCYGPPFILQMSGSGLVAPCGMLFNDRHKELYHIGNITETRFKDIWQSERYWEVMDRIASEKFDARTMCGTLCLQHKVNEFLWEIKNGKEISVPVENKPEHINFI